MTHPLCLSGSGRPWTSRPFAFDGGRCFVSLCSVMLDHQKRPGGDDQAASAVPSADRRRLRSILNGKPEKRPRRVDVRALRRWCGRPLAEWYGPVRYGVVAGVTINRAALARLLRGRKGEARVYATPMVTYRGGRVKSRVLHIVGDNWHATLAACVNAFGASAAEFRLE